MQEISVHCNRKIVYIEKATLGWLFMQYRMDIITDCVHLYTSL